MMGSRAVMSDWRQMSLAGASVASRQLPVSEAVSAAPTQSPRAIQTHPVQRRLEHADLIGPGDRLNPERKPREVASPPNQRGLSGAIRVRDLCAARDFGIATGRIGATLPVYGAALYRLMPP